VSAPPGVVVHADATLLAAAAAARLVTRIVDTQAAWGSAHIALTGGGVGTATLAAVAASPARDAIDWRAVDFWWSDERFLPAGHPDRNETQARAALLDLVPLEPDRVHPMPASDGPFGDDVGAAAREYADRLAAASGLRAEPRAPEFDVLLLGVGPDGHVASLFPGQPALYEADATCVPVRSAPKPPPVRISLTLPAIRRAREVWLLAAGTEKASAVALALQPAGEVAVPAAGASGTRRTLWLLDRAAAREIPPGLARPASP
jgi:6-phosphogluconolactonase